MNPPGKPGTSIADEAEFERWQDIRNETRRRLTVAILVALCYLLASLAVGSYLIRALAEVAQGAFPIMSWYPKNIATSWIEGIVWVYAGLAVIVTVSGILLIALVHGKLPASLSRLVCSTPWIGSTIRIVAMGEFCQAVYQSVLKSQTYTDALEQASRDVRLSDLRQWTKRSSQRLESGISIAIVLQSFPIPDQPLFAVAALIAQPRSSKESAQVWHDATEECHVTAQSRMNRTALVISVTCLLASVLIASFALLISVTMMQGLLEWETSF